MLALYPHPHPHYSFEGVLEQTERTEAASPLKPPKLLLYSTGIE